MDSPETAVKKAIAAEAKQREMNRHLEIYTKLRELAASKTSSKSLTIGWDDAQSIRQITADDLVSAKIASREDAVKIFEANNDFDFELFGVALGGITIVLNGDIRTVLSEVS